MIRSYRVWCATVLVWGIGLGWLSGSATAQTPPAAAHEWASGTHEALAAHLAGDDEGAQRLCTRVLTDGQASAAAQHDAAAIFAMTLLRSTVRSDRVEGLARLSQLGQEDPSLMNEPECNLAYGSAQAALAATTDALEALEAAAAGFAARGQTDRELAALEALADTWLRHGEWELTPARLVAHVPHGAAEIAAERRKQVDALRARAAALPDSAEAVARIDLLLARHLLADEATVAEGRALLERLAAAETLNEPTAEAAFLLAERNEKDGRPAEALRLYERVQRDWHGELVQQAEQRRRELLQPQLVVDVPRSVPSGAKVPVVLRARGLAHVQFEARQVDIEAWLKPPTNRGQESTLPVSGSLRAAREFDPNTGPLTWWNSDGLAFEAEPGAYVVFAQGTRADGPPVVIKRLVLVSDLVAMCQVGRDDVFVWATRAPDAGGAATDFDPATSGVRFWMQRSYMPTRATLAGGLGRFGLPAEARLMTDKRWFCLLRSGAHLALCTGELPASGAGASQATGVALLGGPLEPRVGDTYTVSGFLLGEHADDPAARRPGSFELHGVDALDKVQFVRPLTLAPGGAFTVDLPITADLADKHVRLAVRENGRTLPNVLPRLSFAAAGLDKRFFRVRMDMAGSVERGMRLPLSAEARFPGGRTAGPALFDTWFYFYELPGANGLEDPRLIAFDRLKAPLDEHGRLAADWDMFRLPLPEGPIAVRAATEVSSWEGRVGVAGGNVLCAGGPARAWLRVDPVTPQVGEDVRVWLSWFEPHGRVVLRLPEVAVRRVADDVEVARLRLHPTGVTLISDVWRPIQAGEYELVADIPGFEAPPLAARRRVTVAVAPLGSGPIAAQLSGRAVFDDESGERGVRVHLEGKSGVPLLVLIEGDEPLGGGVVRALAGAANAFVPLAKDVTTGVRAVILGLGRDGPRTLLTLDVGSGAEPSASLLPAGPVEVWPGTTARVAVRCPPALAAVPGVTLTARLIDAEATDFAGLRAGATSPLQLAFENKIGMTVESPGWAPGERGLESVTADALGEGATLWCRCQAVEQPDAELEVRIPAAGVYKLIVVVRAPGLSAVADAVLLDARRGLTAELDGPDRLMVGDRTEVGLRLVSGSRAAIAATVRLEGGDELSIEAIRMPGDEGSMPAGRAEGYAVSVPGGGERWVFVELEAARVGRGRVTGRVEFAGRNCDVGCACEVVPVDPPPIEKPKLQIERELFVWRPSDEPRSATPLNVEEASEAEVGAARDEGARGHTDLSAANLANWGPLQVGERLRPGQYVLVRERIWAYESLRDVSWSQRLPATCAPVASPPKEFATLGGRVAGPADALTLSIRSLATGVSAENCYCLAVVRPGVSVWPAPEVRTGGAVVPVVVAPAEIRLIVAAD